MVTHVKNNNYQTHAHGLFCSEGVRMMLIIKKENIVVNVSFVF